MGKLKFPHLDPYNRYRVININVYFEANTRQLAAPGRDQHRKNFPDRVLLAQACKVKLSQDRAIC
jgi:hypothetical protein